MASESRWTSPRTARSAIPFEKLLTLTREKHLGIDDYWLSAALRRAGEVALLPRMVKPLDLEAMKGFFLARAKEVMDRIG